MALSLGFLVSVLFFCALLWGLLAYFQALQRAKAAPGPFVLPYFGCMFSLTDQKNFHTNFDRLFHQYGKVIRVFVPGMEIVASIRPEDLKHVLFTRQDNYHNDESPVVTEFLGHALVIANGPEWKMQRKTLQPAFKAEYIREMLPIFQKNIDVLLEKYHKYAKSGEHVDCFTTVKQMNFDIIGETAFGYSFQSQSKVFGQNPKDPLEQFCTAIQQMTFLFSLMMFVKSWKFWLSLKLKSVTQYVNSVKSLQTIVEDVISKRKGTDESKSTDIMGFLLRAKENPENQWLTDKNLRDQVSLFLFAGQDTTTVTLAFCLYEIARNPSVYEKARQEISTILKQKQEIEFSDISKFKFIEAIFKETLRRYPPATILGRDAIADDVLPSGHRVFKGQQFMLCIHALHHDSDIWENPYQWNPDRFLTFDENRSPYSFIPFIAGPRTCIGRQFATVLGTSTLVQLLRDFEFQVKPGFQLSLITEPLLRPEFDIPLLVKSNPIQQ